MMWKILFVLFLSNPIRIIQHDTSFKQRVNIIHSKSTDLTDLDILYYSKEFVQVYEHPSVYQESVSKYIGTSESFENKLIAIYSITKLPTADYVRLINFCYSLYQKKKISEELLMQCVINEFDTKYRLLKHYNDQTLRHTLSKISKDLFISEEHRRSLKEFISGKTYQDLKNGGFIKLPLKQKMCK